VVIEGSSQLIKAKDLVLVLGIGRFVSQLCGTNQQTYKTHEDTFGAWGSQKVSPVLRDVAMSEESKMNVRNEDHDERLHQ
jgi:hypothetical protein